MSVIARSELTLRFFGDELVPEEITRELGSPPTRFNVKGERRSYPPESKHIARRSSWLLCAAPRKPGDPDSQVAELFANLTPEIDVWRKLSSKFEADLFCGLWLSCGNDWFQLAANSLKMIGERGLMINFDVYQANLNGSA